MNTEWKLIACPETPGEGQRFFLRDDDPGEGLYICDNSGENPDRTDDGPLRFQAGKEITLGDTSVGIHISIPVLVERVEGRDESRCGVSFKELLWMLESFWAKPENITVGDSLRSMRDVFAHLSKRA